MTTPSPEDILSVDADRIGEFIQHHAGERTLSHMVKRLNDTLLDGEPTKRRRAADALKHLGFVERV
jgi:hypothetical protein